MKTKFSEPTENKGLFVSINLPPTTRSLPIALIRARENVMAPIREMLADTGLTEQQWRVLRVLAEQGPQDATEVSDRACLLLPSLTRIVRSMTERGLITRRRDENDRRRQTLEIAPAGQKVIDDNLAHAVQIAERLRAQIGSEKYELLLDLLEEFNSEAAEQPHLTGSS